MYYKAEKKITKKEDESNYSFILKCMAAAGAALIAAGVVTTIALAATAKTAAAGLAVGVTATAASPIIPIIGIITLVAASLFVLPLLFAGSSSTYISNSTPRSSTYWGSSWGPTVFVPTQGHHHHHHHNHSHQNRHGDGGIFGGGSNTHHHPGHTSGGNFHGHR